MFATSHFTSPKLLSTNRHSHITFLRHIKVQIFFFFFFRQIKLNKNHATRPAAGS